MSRAFTASGHNLRTSSFPNNAAQGSVSCWFRPNWSSGDSAQHVPWWHDTTTVGTYMEFQHYTDNNIYVGWEGGVNTRIVVADTGLFTAGQWAHWLYTWSDVNNNQRLYRNGSLIGSQLGVALASVTFSELTLGNYGSLLPQFNLDGDLAEYAEWDVELDPDEAVALAKGASPLTNPKIISTPHGLDIYFDLIGRYSPEINRVNINANGGGTITVTGAGTGTHPPIFYPRRRAIGQPSAVAATGYLLVA
jgi:hypothetical protein